MDCSPVPKPFFLDLFTDAQQLKGLLTTCHSKDIANITIHPSVSANIHESTANEGSLLTIWEQNRDHK